MPTVYTESGLHLSFGDEWLVLRYDKHPFYRYISGRGYRGVDFILLHRTAPSAVWIEVKNYRSRRKRKTGAKVQVALPSQDNLKTLLNEKYEGTRRGLAQIAGYYRRKWWWHWPGRQLLEYAHNKPSSWAGGRLRQLDWVQFVLLDQLAASPNTSLLLVLATDQIPPSLTADSYSGIGTVKKQLSCSPWELLLPAANTREIRL